MPPSSAALETLAPVTASTFSDCVLITSWAMVSRATLPTPIVSLLSEVSMSESAYFVNVHVTVKGALCPITWAV